jgi:hypothetical protein
MRGCCGRGPTGRDIKSAVSFAADAFSPSAPSAVSLGPVQPLPGPPWALAPLTKSVSRRRVEVRSLTLAAPC